MSPNGQQSQGKAPTSNNLYTVILALAFFAVLTTVALVAYTCYFQYGTILKIP